MSSSRLIEGTIFLHRLLMGVYIIAPATLEENWCGEKLGCWYILWLPIENKRKRLDIPIFSKRAWETQGIPLTCKLLVTWYTDVTLTQPNMGRLPVGDLPRLLCWAENAAFVVLLIRVRVTNTWFLENNRIHRHFIKGSFLDTRLIKNPSLPIAAPKRIIVNPRSRCEHSCYVVFNISSVVQRSALDGQSIELLNQAISEYLM